MPNIPNRGEEIKQTVTEIPVTLGSHSWGKRKGFKLPQEPRVTSFVGKFAFSDHREKSLQICGFGDGPRERRAARLAGLSVVEADYC